MKLPKKIFISDRTYSFDAALDKLLSSQCIGISPIDDMSYLVLAETDDPDIDETEMFLKWVDSKDDHSSCLPISISSALGDWHLILKA